MDEPEYRDTIRIFHTHGRFDTKESIILTERDYTNRYHEGSLATKCLWLIAATKQVVFIGFGFRDFDLLSAFRQVRGEFGGGDPRHFALVGIKPDQEGINYRNYLWDKFGIEIDQLSSIQSEVQLFGLYWHERINKKADGEDRRMLLVNTAKAMVDYHLLSVSRSDVYQMPGYTNTLNALLSDQVLREISASGERIAYAHNMLFDYAVSRLLIPEEPKEAVQFLREEISRPIFLRPSISYYFARLWHDERDIFWKIFCVLYV